MVTDGSKPPQLLYCLLVTGFRKARMRPSIHGATDNSVQLSNQLKLMGNQSYSTYLDSGIGKLRSNVFGNIV